MTFVSLGFLFAAAAGAIPVVLHMINRQKAKEMPFSTLRFLRLSVQRTRRKRRIHDLLLMLLRMAALVLLAVGLAEPTITNLSSFWGGGTSAVAIVLDNSASMGQIDEGVPRFETARAAAHQIMDQLAPGDQVALMLSGGPEFPEEGHLHRAHEKVLQLLDQTAVSYERADLAMKVRDARKLLDASAAQNKQIYVLTDLQALSWEGLAGDSLAAPSGPGGAASAGGADPASENPVIFVDCHRAPKPNVAISGLDLAAAVPVAGVTVQATVELLNASEAPQQRNLELHLDGARQAGSPLLKIPPRGRLKHVFQFQFERGGLHRGEVRLIGDDGSIFDNRRFFTIQVNQAIPVAIVKPRRHEITYLEDSFYVERALAPGRSGGWAIRTTILTADELISEPLGNYTAIFCVNLPAPEADAAGRLADYAARGGNLFWFSGDNVDPEAYNRMNDTSGGRLLPCALNEVRSPEPETDRDSWHIGFLDKTHPALGDLTEPAALYQSVLVYKHVRMDAKGSPEARVMARLDDGEPLLVQRGVQQGTTTMLGTSAHVGWTNLPVRPLFLPLLARLTFELAGGERTRHQALAGSPLILPLEDQLGPSGVEVLPPSGATIRLSTEDDEGNPRATFTYADTHEVGIYQLRLLEAVRPRQIAYSVNVDPDEANPSKITPEELETRFAGTPLVFAGDPHDLSSTFTKLKEGESLWEIFLAVVLLLLVFETFLANRLSPKKEDDQFQNVAPGMRRLAKKGRGAA